VTAEPVADDVGDDVAVVPEAAVESAEGDWAWNELRAASRGMTPPIWLSSVDHGKRPETSWRTSTICCLRCWAAVAYCV
jgi:hypothetical protein